MRALWWSLPLSIAIAAIAYSTALYNIEEAKQAAFMMKVCTDAGGSWLQYWSGKPYCQRPVK